MQKAPAGSSGEVMALPRGGLVVKTSAGLGSKSATAKLEILCAWATEPDPLKAELIDGAPGSEASKNVHAPPIP